MINGKRIANIAESEENAIPLDSVIYELRQFGLDNDDIAEILKKAAKIEKDVKNV